jgi:hypothetical protein
MPPAECPESAWKKKGTTTFLMRFAALLSRLETVNGRVDNEPEKKILSPAACG